MIDFLASSLSSQTLLILLVAMRLTTLYFMVTLDLRGYKLATSSGSGFCLVCRRGELHVQVVLAFSNIPINAKLRMWSIL
jgi:hypothetical protein